MALWVCCFAESDGFLRRGIHVDLYFLADAKYKGTRIFQSPLHVRDGEVGLDGEAACGGLHGHVHRHRVVLPVESEDAVDDEDAVDRLAKSPIDTARAKGDQLISIAVEDIFMHPVVARGVAAFSAGGIDLDQAACCTGERVAADGSLLQPERAADSVQGIAERPFDRCCRRVQDDVDRMRRLSVGASDEEQQRACQKEDSNLADGLVHWLHFEPLIV